MPVPTLFGQYLLLPSCCPSIIFTDLSPTPQTSLHIKTTSRFFSPSNSPSCLPHSKRNPQSRFLVPSLTQSHLHPPSFIHFPSSPGISASAKFQQPSHDLRVFGKHSSVSISADSHRCSVPLTVSPSNLKTNTNLSSSSHKSTQSSLRKSPYPSNSSGIPHFPHVLHYTHSFIISPVISR